MRNVLCVVLDGAADRSYPELDDRSPLEASNMPVAREIARRSLGGLMYPLGRGRIPESDTAALAFFGYRVEHEYFGRAPIEALGLGLDFGQGDLALHLNFAEVEAGSRVLRHRAVPELTEAESSALCESVESAWRGASQSGSLTLRSLGRFGYRAIGVFRSNGELSGQISNTDPAHRRVGYENYANATFDMIAEDCRPLNDSLGAIRTAAIVNQFAVFSHDILEHHPVNAERKATGRPLANYFLMRSAGSSLPPKKDVAKQWGGKMAMLAEGGAEKGIARLCGLELIRELQDPSIAVVYNQIARDLAAAASTRRFTYAHIKGPDEPSHNGDVHGKVASLENIDRHLLAELVPKLDPNATILCLTSDHATHCATRIHTQDPVPLIVTGSEPGSMIDFSERSATTYGTIRLAHGNDLLPFLLVRP